MHGYHHKATHHKATLLFDVDGTLIDSYPGIREGFVRGLRAVGRREGAGLPSEEWLRKLPGPPMRDSMAAAGLTPDEVERAMEAYSDYMSAEGWREFTVFDGMAELVAELRGEGFGVVTATSKSEKYASLALREAGISVDFLGAADLDAGRVTKPQVIAHVLDSVDVHNPLMIGDREHDYDGAAEFGIPSVAVTWGYGDAAEWAKATRTARTPEELRKAIHDHSH